MHVSLSSVSFSRKLTKFKEGGCQENLWFIAKLSKHRRQPGLGVGIWLGGGAVSWDWTLNLGIWGDLQVDSASNELNCGTPAGVGELLGAGGNPTKNPNSGDSAYFCKRPLSVEYSSALENMERAETNFLPGIYKCTDSFWSFGCEYDSYKNVKPGKGSGGKRNEGR